MNGIDKQLKQVKDGNSLMKDGRIEILNGFLPLNGSISMNTSFSKRKLRRKKDI